MDSKDTSTGKVVIFSDLHHGTADDSPAAKAVYARLESSRVLHRVHDIFQTYLNMRNVDPCLLRFCEAPV